MENKEFFQRLEALIYFLQLPEWPLEEKISRQQAIALIANFFNLDPEDPELSQKALLELQKIFTEEKPTPNIPINLKEIVEDYEKFLASQEKEFKEISSYWNYYQKVSEELLEKIKNPWLNKIVGIQITKKIAGKLPAVSHPQAFLETFSHEEYQSILQQSVEESLPPGIQLSSKKTKELKEKTQLLAASLAATPRPEIILGLSRFPEEYNLLKETLTKAISSLPSETQKFNKEVISQIEKEIENKIIKGESISLQEYSQIISQAVFKTSRAQKLPPNISSQAKKMLDNTYPQIKELIDKTNTILEKINNTFKALPESKKLLPDTQKNLQREIIKKFTPLLITYTIPPSPQIEKNASQIFKNIGLTLSSESIKNIGEKIEKNIIETLVIKKEFKGVAFKPIFTFLHPPTAISAAKKIALAPIVKPLQWVVKITPEDIPEEIKKTILEGLTSNDIQESVKDLQESGFPPQYPKIDQLITIQQRLFKFESSHKILSFLLRHYHEFSKKTDSRQIQESKTELWLPKNFPPTSWQGQKGYAWTLRERLNKLGVFLKTHRWLPSPTGRTIRFVLSDKIIRMLTFGKIQSLASFKKVAYQKIVQPVLIWSGKTAVGKAIKTGAKKLVSWGLSKLGISLAVPAVGAAAGPPGWVVALISFLPNIISWVKRGLKKLLEKPEIAILLGIGLISLPIFIPMAPVLWTVLAIVGIISTGIGLLAKGGALLAGIAGKIGGFLNSATITISSFFSFLPTISLPTALPIVAIGGSLGLTTGLTLLTVVTVGSAFLEEGKGETPSYFGSLVTPRPPGKARHLAEEVIWTLNNCGITAVNKITWKETEKCLYNSTLPNKEIIINQFRFSVFEVGPGLQCVGFVRGVMAALGKDPGGGRHARGYLDSPTPSGYYPVDTNMNNIQIGDLIIWKGGNYGHIAIVINTVDKNGIKYIHVAEAIGTNNGTIRISEVNSVYFNGFLRPK
jgi:hypothetical protein